MTIQVTRMSSPRVACGVLRRARPALQRPLPCDPPGLDHLLLEIEQLPHLLRLCDGRRSLGARDETHSNHCCCHSKTERPCARRHHRFAFPSKGGAADARQCSRRQHCQNALSTKPSPKLGGTISMSLAGNSSCHGVLSTLDERSSQRSHTIQSCKLGDTSYMLNRYGIYPSIINDAYRSIHIKPRL